MSSWHWQWWLFMVGLCSIAVRSSSGASTRRSLRQHTHLHPHPDSIQTHQQSQRLRQLSNSTPPPPPLLFDLSQHGIFPEQRAPQLVPGHPFPAATALEVRHNHTTNRTITGYFPPPPIAQPSSTAEVAAAVLGLDHNHVDLFKDQDSALIDRIRLGGGKEEQEQERLSTTTSLPLRDSTQSSQDTRHDTDFDGSSLSSSSSSN